MNHSETASHARTLGAVARFHAPLVAQAALLALVGPVLQHALARAADPHAQVAAFWVAFSIAGLLQAGVLAVQPAALAGLRRGVAPTRIAIAAAAVGIATSAILLALGVLVVARPGALAWCGVDASLGVLAGRVLVTLAALPPFVAARGVACGRLLAGGRAAPIAWAGIARLAALAVATSSFVPAPGDEAVGAARCLVTAAMVECAVAGLATLRQPASANASAGSARGLRGVALPILASLLAWSVMRPLVHSVLGRLEQPVDAQAAFGALMPVLMLAAAPLWTLFDVTLALPRDDASLGAVRRYAVLCAGIMIALFALGCWPPAGAWLLERACGVPPALVHEAAAALPWLVPLPAVLAARAIGNARLLRHGGFDRVWAFAPLRLALVGLAGLGCARAMPEMNGTALGVGLVVFGDALDLALVTALLARVGGSAPAQAAADELHEWREAA